MYTFAVVQQKGGVGKSEVSVGTAGELARRGHSVLVGDLDPQGNATATALRLPRIPVDQPSVAAYMAGDYNGPIDALITHHSTTAAGGRIDVLANSSRMWTAARDLDRRADRERQLRRLLDEVEDRYDYCSLDTPPALDLWTDNALAAADGVLIPVQPEDSSIEALNILFHQINALERALNRPPLDRIGMVVSNYRTPVSKIAQTVIDALVQIRGIEVLAYLPLAVVVPESWRAGVPVPVHDPNHEHTTQLALVADAVEAISRKAGGQ